MGSPFDMIFGVFSETYVMLVISIILHFFSRYSKYYNNLNVKSYLKFNGPWQKDGLSLSSFIWHRGVNVWILQNYYTQLEDHNHGKTIGGKL